MTNTEIIQAIHKEIITRIDKRHLSEQANNELVSILHFLSTLDSLQQKQQEIDLAKEIEAASKRYPEVSYAKLSRIAKRFFELGQIDAANKYNEIENNRQRAEEESLGKTLDEAAHQYAWNKQEHHIDFDGDEYLDYGPRYDAFKAGAKWQEEKNQEIIKLAEDHAFLAGADWQKEQMMKDAVEGEICGRVYDHINVRFADGVCKYLEPKNISHIPADVSKYNIGDKIRIIIVKED